ncbi:hypothetical protein C1M53_15270 [Mesorhizobium sp. Pch-S]|nr:hypothetical protein C1M53_15270 [Mesorhizobium sp. Pch-S]
MGHRVHRLRAISQAERELLLETMLGETQELAFKPRGEPDPRLVKLARLLGRQLARQNFETQKPTPRSKNS